MSSINDYLLDELLIIIFGSLTPVDRKTCRLVCQHWNELILNEVKFRSDWHLYVDHSTLTPGDFELLLQSRVEFSSITLDLSKTFEHFDKLVKVLTQIGKSVNKIVIKKIPTEHCHRIINSLPLLKWIEIDSELNLKCINRNTTVEHLKLTYFHYFPSNILDLFEVFPNIQSLDYDLYILNDYICMIKSFRTAPTLWKVIDWVDGDPRFDEFQTEFLQFEKLNLDRFRYYYSSANEHKFDLHCEECWNTLIISFPNLEHLQLVVPLSYDKLIKAISHWKNLKFLKLYMFKRICDDSKGFEPFPTSMLENLHCIIRPVNLFQNLINFLKCLPELKYLKIIYEWPCISSLANAKKVADAIVTYCKKLREFSIELKD